jgi:HEAT repeat protein
MIRLGQLVRTPDLLPPLRCRALAGMMRSGENGLLQFAQQLAGRPDPLVRRLVAAVLPLLPTAESLPWLMQLAADEDGMVRQTAVRSLTLWQHLPKTEAAIVQALIGPDEALALLTAELLALNGPPGVEILQEALADEAVAVRRAAIHGLARLDEAWTPARLAEMERSDPVWLVQSAAAGAIEQIRKRQEPHTWQPILAVRQRWLSAATGKRPSDEAAALAAVVRVLQEDADEGARTAAANLLCFVPVMAAEEGLHTAVQSNNPKLKRAAFAALCVGDRAFAG